MLLDTLRKHSRSFIIYIIFGIIIAVFVVNFGPQSQGCTASTSYMAKVEGTVVSGRDFAYALAVSGVRGQSVPEPQMVRLRAMVMDQILVRELLAEDALDVGIRIPDKSIDDMLLEGRFLALGRPHSLRDGEDADWSFDYDHFSRMVKYYWRLTVKTFKEIQRRELLAERLKELLRGAMKLSEDEVRADYLRENTQVTLSYVRFTPGKLRPRVMLTPAEVEQYAMKHKDAIKAYYEENKTRYENLPQQVKLQVIRFKKADDARQKAERARAQIKGGEDFGKVATELSEDPDSSAAGGVLGWRNADSPGLGDAATKAIAALKQGGVSEIIEGEEYLTIAKVVQRREGTLSLEQAKLDIAEELLRDEKAVELAKQQAADYIARAQKGATLETLFGAGEADEAQPDQEAPATQPTSDEQQADAKAPAATPEHELATTGAFPRSGRHLVPGIGISEELMELAFDLEQGKVAPKPFVVNDMVYLVAVKERTEPDWSEWKKNKDDLVEQAINRKWAEVLRSYAYERCKAAVESNDIRVPEGALMTPGYQHPQDEPPLPRYEPCSSLQIGG